MQEQADALWATLTPQQQESVEKLLTQAEQLWAAYGLYAVAVLAVAGASVKLYEYSKYDGAGRHVV